MICLQSKCTMRLNDQPLPCCVISSRSPYTESINSSIIELRHSSRSSSDNSQLSSQLRLRNELQRWHISLGSFICSYSTRTAKNIKRPVVFEERKKQVRRRIHGRTSRVRLGGSRKARKRRKSLSVTDRRTNGPTDQRTDRHTQ